MQTIAQRRAALSAKQADWKVLWESKPDRNFSSSELARLQALNDEMSDLGEELRQAEDLGAMTRPTGSLVPNGDGSVHPFGTDRPTVTSDVPHLGSSDKLADVVKRETGIDAERYSFGEFVRGIHSGEWSDSGLQMMAITSGTSGGGNLVPAPLSARVLDLARAQSRVMQAGAQTIPLTSDTLKIARVESDPAVYWHGEGVSDITASDPVLGAVSFSARSLAAKVLVTRELLEDAQNLNEVLTNTLSQAFAAEMDRVALFGTGGTQPTGLVNMTGFTSVPYTSPDGGALAAATAYQRILSAILNVEANNYTVTGMLAAPRTIGGLYGLQGSDNQPLQPPAKVAEIPIYPTTRLPVNETLGANSDTSRIVMGQWDQLMIGIRTSFRIMIREDSTLDSSAQLAVFAWMRADVQAININAFSGVHGIRA